MPARLFDSSRIAAASFERPTVASRLSGAGAVMPCIR